MFSEMSSYLIEQINNIVETAKDKNSFNYNYEKLHKNRFSAINEQLNFYERKSKETIKSEIISEILEQINFEEMKTEIKDDFKNKKFKPFYFEEFMVSKKTHLKKYSGKLEQFKIPIFDNQELEHLHHEINSSDDNSQSIKSFEMYCKRNLNKLIKFEKALVREKEIIKLDILNDLDEIKELYKSYLFQLKKNKLNAYVPSKIKDFYGWYLRKII